MMSDDSKSDKTSLSGSPLTEPMFKLNDQLVVTTTDLVKLPVTPSSSTTTSITSAATKTNEEVDISNSDAISNKSLNLTTDADIICDDNSVSGAEPAEEAIDLLAVDDPDEVLSTSDVSFSSPKKSLSELTSAVDEVETPNPWYMSPTVWIAIGLVAIVLTRFNLDFIFGVLTSLVLSPIIAYFVIKYYLLRETHGRNFSDPSSG